VEISDGSSLFCFGKPQAADVQGLHPWHLGIIKMQALNIHHENPKRPSRLALQRASLNTRSQQEP
jgi:hypothetical protein